MTDRYDVIVIGMGPGVAVASSQLLEAGKRVAVIERELVLSPVVRRLLGSGGPEVSCEVCF